MKLKWIILLVLSTSFTAVKAQLIIKNPLSTSEFSENLAKITQDFRNNYYQIQGVLLSREEDMDTYSSLVILPGSQHNIIYRFHSKNDSSASWQAVLYEGDNYKEALKIYKNTCKQVSKTKVQLYGNLFTSFKGSFEPHDENLRFASSVYTLNNEDAIFGKFYAEVELLNLTYDSWTVHINMQSKKDDTEK